MSHRSLYAVAGVLFLTVSALDLPDVELHGVLFLFAALACFGVAARPMVSRTTSD